MDCRGLQLRKPIRLAIRRRKGSIPARFSGGDATGLGEPRSDLRVSPRACTELAGRFSRGATRSKGLRQRQAVLTVVGNDEAGIAGVPNGQLRGAARALRLIHDAVAELIEAGGTSGSQSARDVGGFHFAFGRSRCEIGGGGFKPESLGVELQRARLLRCERNGIESEARR